MLKTRLFARRRRGYLCFAAPPCVFGGAVLRCAQKRGRHGCVAVAPSRVFALRYARRLMNINAAATMMPPAIPKLATIASVRSPVLGILDVVLVVVVTVLVVLVLPGSVGFGVGLGVGSGSGSAASTTLNVHHPKTLA